MSSRNRGKTFSDADQRKTAEAAAKDPDLAMPDPRMLLDDADVGDLLQQNAVLQVQVRKLTKALQEKNAIIARLKGYQPAESEMPKAAETPAEHVAPVPTPIRPERPKAGKPEIPAAREARAKAAAESAPKVAPEAAAATAEG